MTTTANGLATPGTRPETTTTEKTDTPPAATITVTRKQQLRVIDTVAGQNIRQLTPHTIDDFAPERKSLIDVLFVNPPSPDGEVWIRDIHRVGRRSREKMIWPQTELAGLAAVMEQAGQTTEILDCIAEEMGWEAFQAYLDKHRPRYMVTNVTAPTLTNDLYTTFLAKPLGTTTIAIGSHVTPMAYETMKNFPTLDAVIRLEPEFTLREIVQTIDEGKTLHDVLGVVFRHDGEVIVNRDRPFIADLDDLPMPLYHKLPLQKYRIPMVNGPYCFVVTSRGCTAGCRFCIKHVMWQNTVRSHTPERILAEMKELKRLGIDNVHFYADLFTVDREVVVALCKLIVADGLQMKWTCNSRVDYIDKEMLHLMAAAGCWMISWGLESGSMEVLKRMRKGIKPEKTRESLELSHKLGMKNWGYFIIGMPGETVDTIDETIAFAKSLPLTLALFHIAVPYPGTPFYYEAVENGWIKANRWEDMDMDRSTTLNYPHLSSRDLERHAKRAFREWAMRPGPAMTYLKSLSSPTTLRAALSIGVEHMKWIFSSRGDNPMPRQRVSGSDE